LSDADHKIVELSNAVLRLRSDLRIDCRDFGGEMCYVIEDSFRAKFYRVGPAEHLFIMLLDGTRTIHAAIAVAAGKLRELAFSENEALAICRWLLETQLVENAGTVDHVRLSKKAEERPSYWAALRNPLWIRLPLFNPTAALNKVEPWLAWTLGRPFFIAWSLCCVYAIGVVVSNWDALVGDTIVLLDRSHWLLLIISWLLLKLLHETYHALVCRKYGGTVSEAGIFLLLLAPVPYVELSSSWRFASKWRRIAAAAAGIYVELFVAAIAVIVWTNSPSNTTKHIATSIAVMASVGTLLVNANPLMRFDGYFILSDLIGIPNLNARGRQWLRTRFERLLGVASAPLGLTSRKARFVSIYATAALVWRVLVYLTLLSAILILLARVHMLLALAAASAMLAGVASRTYSYVASLANKPAVSARRMVFVGAMAVVVLAGVALLLAGPSTIRCPGIVEYHPLVIVRTASPGFIRQLCIEDGDTVVTDQVLAVLENGELALELRMAELEIEKSVAKCRILRQAGETAKEQAELATQTALQQKRIELARQIESLTIRAPNSGKVIGRNLASWRGRYVETGAELLLIGDDTAKEVVVALAHDDVDLVSQHGEAPITVRFAALGASSIEATLDTIEPRATMHPPHEALSSKYGGPLAVQVVDDSSHSDAASAYQLLDPCFKASVRLTAEQSARLRAGQLATIEFSSTEQSWARRAQVIVHRWFDQRLRSAE